MLELIFDEMGKKVYSDAEYWASRGGYDKAKDLIKTLKSMAMIV